MPSHISSDKWSGESKQDRGEEMKAGDDKSTWVIGGTTLIGLGAGLIFVKTSALAFVASLLIGIGAGLVLAPLVLRHK
jgi:hypothetical protein